MDKKFLDKLSAYMAQPEEKRDLMDGATMLLQLNRNRILNQNIVRNPQRHKERLFHELNKYLNIHSDNMTVQDIIEMEKQVPEIETTSLKKIEQSTDKSGAVALGQREDHDALPESIKALWVQNGEYAKRMKSLHEKLKLMSDMQPCDRYDTLKLLIDTDKKYRENWAKYDAYVIAPVQNDKGAKTDMQKVEGQTAQVDANRVSANRKYLSLNKGKLAAHKEKNDLPKYHTLLEKMQERYDELQTAGCSLDEKQLNELVALGLKA